MQLVLWLPLILAVPTSLLTAFLLRKRRPGFGRGKLAWCSALPAAAIPILLGAAWFLSIASTPAPPDEIDASGMALVAIMTLTPPYAAVAMALGAVAVAFVYRRG